MLARVHSRSPEEGIGLMRSVLSRGRGVATASCGVRVATPGGPRESRRRRSMSVRGLTLRVATALCALAGALLLSSTSALAIRLVGTPLPAPTGGFSAPQGLGVGPSPNNEIFVENNGVSTVDVYGSNAIFKAEFPVAAGYGYQMG